MITNTFICMDCGSIEGNKKITEPNSFLVGKIIAKCKDSYFTTSCRCAKCKDIIYKNMAKHLKDLHQKGVKG